MFGFILLLHILGASVWTGGHLVLATVILPRALKHRDVEGIRNFENAYEKIGIPALVAQIASGLWLAHRMLPDVSLWFQWSHPLGRLVAIKLTLLAITAALGIDARLRVIPRLGAHNLNTLAWHIVPVTLLSVLFVVVGVSFRTGWFMW
jgi:putative copper export protein